MVAAAVGRGLRALLRKQSRFYSFVAAGRTSKLPAAERDCVWNRVGRTGLENPWIRGSSISGCGHVMNTFSTPLRYMCKDAEDEREPVTAAEKKVHEEKKRKERDEDDEKRRVLDAALVHVPTLGWSEAAIAAGARDVNLSPAILGAFHRREAALVEYFMEESLDDLVDAVEDQREELEKLVVRERLSRILRMRLEMQAPYASKWAQALSIQANPINLPVAMKQRAVLMDEIWHAVGDRSTDWDWYTKRAILGGVYTASEVYMLTDYSPGFRDTWTFMDKRLVDAIDCRKTAKEAAQLAQAIGAGLGNTIASFLKQPRPGP